MIVFRGYSVSMEFVNGIILHYGICAVDAFVPWGMTLPLRLLLRLRSGVSLGSEVFLLIPLVITSLVLRPESSWWTFGYYYTRQPELRQSDSLIAYHCVYLVKAKLEELWKMHQQIIWCEAVPLLLFLVFKSSKQSVSFWTTIPTSTMSADVFYIIVPREYVVFLDTALRVDVGFTTIRVPLIALSQDSITLILASIRECCQGVNYSQCLWLILMISICFNEKKICRLNNGMLFCVVMEKSGLMFFLMF